MKNEKKLKVELEKIEHCLLCQSKSLKWLDKKNNICQCKNCGYIFDNPRPTRQTINNYYSSSDNFDCWLEEESARDVLWQRRLRLVKKYKPNGSLLDVGAGIGQFLHFAQNDFSVTGTEVSSIAIKIALDKYKLKLIPGEIEKISLSTKFDLITLFHVLEHVSNPASQIDKCKELLNKKGILIIAVPNDLNVKLPLKRLLCKLKIGHFKDYGKFGIPRIKIDSSFGEIHLSHFTPKVLTTFLQKRGFEILHKGLDPYYGSNSMKQNIKFSLFSTINKVFKINLYDTILIVAQKDGGN